MFSNTSATLHPDEDLATFKNLYSVARGQSLGQSILVLFCLMQNKLFIKNHQEFRIFS